MFGPLLCVHASNETRLKQSPNADERGIALPPKETSDKLPPKTVPKLSVIVRFVRFVYGPGYVTAHAVLITVTGLRLDSIPAFGFRARHTAARR
mgnify:CR=1 FL=1